MTSPTMDANATVSLDGPGVSIEDVRKVARGLAPVELTQGAIDRMANARAVVDRLAEGDPKYGISTQCTTPIYAQ